MIEHQPENNRFLLREETHECVLEYVLEDKQINFTRTYVPFALRGQGLAEKLVRSGLAWANEQQYDIVASCWYVKKFLEAG